MHFLLISSIAYRDPKLKIVEEEGTQPINQKCVELMCMSYEVFDGVISGLRNDCALVQNKN
jgi:hypothetical protein